ncbi:hypothetical protein GCM10009765_84310 [Fodinicola feengrottensis]|uniref:RNA polymerase sigma factor 70 region 4 type 2 domain-containing protein n=1 Tax=Fodinicola feengrottensis TaxID=435914 RepID=A0ABP4VH49_9ACTN
MVAGGGRNIAVSKWRRAKRYALLLRKSADPHPVMVETSPDRVVVMEAIGKLPRNQAETIALHYIADLPVAEIAECMRVSVGTVKSRLARGRAALAEILGDRAADLSKVGKE